MVKKILLSLLVAVFLLAAQPAGASNATGLRQMMKHFKEQYHPKKHHGRR